jgi:hypothetical protein
MDLLSVFSVVSVGDPSVLNSKKLSVDIRNAFFELTS